MPPAGFELIISAGERSQTDALDRTATGADILWLQSFEKFLFHI